MTGKTPREVISAHVAELIAARGFIPIGDPAERTWHIPGDELGRTHQFVHIDFGVRETRESLSAWVEFVSPPVVRLMNGESPSGEPGRGSGDWTYTQFTPREADDSKSNVFFISEHTPEATGSLLCARLGLLLDAHRHLVRLDAWPDHYAAQRPILNIPGIYHILAGYVHLALGDRDAARREAEEGIRQRLAASIHHRAPRYIDDRLLALSEGKQPMPHKEWKPLNAPPPPKNPRLRAKWLAENN